MDKVLGRTSKPETLDELEVLQNNLRERTDEWWDRSVRGVASHLVMWHTGLLGDYPEITRDLKRNLMSWIPLHMRYKIMYLHPLIRGMDREFFIQSWRSGKIVAEIIDGFVDFIDAVPRKTDERNNPLILVKLVEQFLTSSAVDALKQRALLAKDERLEPSKEPSWPNRPLKPAVNPAPDLYSSQSDKVASSSNSIIVQMEDLSLESFDEASVQLFIQKVKNNTAKGYKLDRNTHLSEITKCQLDVNWEILATNKSALGWAHCPEEEFFSFLRSLGANQNGPLANSGSALARVQKRLKEGIVINTANLQDTLIKTISSMLLELTQEKTILSKEDKKGLDDLFITNVKTTGCSTDF